MSRKHLEEAILAGQLIENGLQPIFRFSKIETYKRIETMDNPEYDDVSVHAVQFNKDGQLLALGAANSTVRILSTASPYKLRTIKTSRFSHGFPVTCLRFLTPPHDVMFGSSPEGEIYAMSVHREGFETVLREDIQTHCFDVTPNGLELATAGKNLDICIYSVERPDGCEFARLKPLKGFVHSAVDHDLTEGHGQRVFVVRYHPDRHQQLFTAGWDNIIKIWDTRLSKGPTLRIIGPHICSPDGLDICGEELLTASWVAKEALQVWDLRMLCHGQPTIPSLAVPLVGPVWNSGPMAAEYLYCCKFADNNCVIAGGSGFNGVRVVNRYSFEAIGDLQASMPIQTCDSIFGGRQIAAGCADGSVYLLRMR